MTGEGPMMSTGSYTPGATAGGQSVPSSGTQDIGALISAGLPTISDEMIKKALSPSFDQHALTMPAKMMQPVQPFQPGQLDHREVVGKGNARAQGIGNSVIAMSNMVGKIANVIQQKKQLNNATRVQKLLETQQSIDAAQSALKDDPNNAEAKKALQQNTQIRDAMFEDPKFVKLVQKGFDISFTNPQDNKTPEHATVQQGIQLAKQRASSYGQQFASAQPTKPTPNIMAQQRLAMAQAQQQQYAKVYAAVLPKIFAQRDTMARAQYVQGMMNMRQMNNHIYEAWQLGQRFTHDEQLAGLKHTYRLGEISSSIQQSGQKMMELFQAEKLDPTELFKTQTSFTQQAVKNEGSMNSAISATQQSMASLTAAMSRPGADKKALQAEYQKAQYQLQSLQQQQQNWQTYKNSWYGVMQNLQNISAGMSGGGVNGAGGSTNNSGSSSNQPGGGNTFDPSALLFGSPFQYGASASTTALLPAPASSGDDEDEDNPDE